MKRFSKIIATLLATLTLLSALTATAGAVTVTKDGKEYLFGRTTPTTGDINVLTIRLGFADYGVDEKDYPADSEETLLSYFDGFEDSVNGYYETASYGKLHLSCDKVYSYNAKYSRDDYNDSQDYALSSVDADSLREISFSKKPMMRIA